jgi:hypothetical protein
MITRTDASGTTTARYLQNADPRVGEGVLMRLIALLFARLHHVVDPARGDSALPAEQHTKQQTDDEGAGDVRKGRSSMAWVAVSAARSARSRAILVVSRARSSACEPGSPTMSLTVSPITDRSVRSCARSERTASTSFCQASSREFMLIHSRNE